MHPSLQKLMLAAHTRLHAYNKAKDSADPDERINKEDMASDLFADFDEVTYAEVHDMKEGEVSCLDMDFVAPGGTRVWSIRMLTQNTKKRDKKDKRRLSEYAKLARKGHDITWILQRPGRGRGVVCDAWLARIDNGVYTRLRGEGESFKLEVPKEANSMAEHIRQVAGALPEIPFGHVAEVVATVGKMGLLK